MDCGREDRTMAEALEFAPVTADRWDDLARLAAGFEEIGRVGKRRHAMRRWLRPGGARGHSAAG